MFRSRYWPHQLALALLAAFVALAAACSDAAHPVAPSSQIRRDGFPFPPACTATNDQCICDRGGHCCLRMSWCVVGDTAPTDSLELVANPTLIFNPPAPVAFDVHTAGSVPVQVISWTWQATGTTGPPQTNPSVCGTATTCSVAVYESGVMTVTAMVNGKTQTATASVAVSPCPPSGDSALDWPAVRQGFADALRNSNPNATPGTGSKKEHGGYIWQAPDGHYYTQEVTDPNATECTYNNQVPPPAPPIAGSQIYGKYHTHPSSANEDTYGCPGASQTPGDGLPVPKADPDNPRAGGGSSNDWDSTQDGYPLYAITKTDRIYRLNPFTRVQDRAKNSNKWSVSGASGCPTRIQ